MFWRVLTLLATMVCSSESIDAAAIQKISVFQKPQELHQAQVFCDAYLNCCDYFGNCVSYAPYGGGGYGGGGYGGGGYGGGGYAPGRQYVPPSPGLAATNGFCRRDYRARPRRGQYEAVQPFASSTYCN
jgi:hypothetical protein